MASGNRREGMKPPLYRKENTTARGVWRNAGGRRYRHDRNAKALEEWERDQTVRGMNARKQGRDYTPLFRFLLSRVGRDWPEVYAEAIARLDDEEPIWWIVAKTPEQRQQTVLVGESSHYSGMYVNDQEKLAIVDPTLSAEHLAPGCLCCTHTLNGVPFVRPYDGVHFGDVRKAKAP